MNSNFNEIRRPWDNRLWLQDCTRICFIFFFFANNRKVALDIMQMDHPIKGPFKCKCKFLRSNKSIFHLWKTINIETFILHIHKLYIWKNRGFLTNNELWSSTSQTFSLNESFSLRVRDIRYFPTVFPAQAFDILVCKFAKKIYK